MDLPYQQYSTVTLTANACFVHSQNKGIVLPSQSEVGNEKDTSEFPEVNELMWHHYIQWCYKSSLLLATLWHWD